jgi:endonuclease/exonuclease/phosphatase family metal-dependent hydrolase
MSKLITLVAGLGLLAACSQDTPMEPASAAPTASHPEASQAGGAERVVVLNQNVYPGANVDAVITALANNDPTDDLPALFAALEELRVNDAQARAAGIVDQIARYRPDVVGLNEITEIDVDLHPIGVDVEVHQRILDLIQAEISARGLPYTVGASVKDIEAQPYPFVSYVDYDVVLVNTERVSVTAPISQTFSLNLGEVAPGIVLKRGWAGVEAEIDGRAYTIVTAHPEPGDPWADLRAAQAAELVASIGTEHPAIMLGDYNDVPGSPLYQVITGADFTDLWAALRPGVRGYTAIDGYDLSAQHLPLVKRIDYVWTRGFDHGTRPVLGDVKLIDDQPADRVPGPDGAIYVSDHAGMLATILLPPTPED